MIKNHTFTDINYSHVTFYFTVLQWLKNKIKYESMSQIWISLWSLFTVLPFLKQMDPFKALFIGNSWGGILRPLYLFTGLLQEVHVYFNDTGINL